MKIERRYIHQIQTVKHVFGIIDESFQAKKAVDRSLSGFFRTNSQFGSKDRKLISNTIFGYYRWYGWLNQLDSQKICLALLLGYLLDGNKINELILFWGKQSDFDSQAVLQFEGAAKMSIREKALLISSVVPYPDPSRLNPSWVPSWSLSLIGAFQKRPNLWVRFVERDQERFLSFLDHKKVEFRFHKKSRNSLEILSSVNLHESIDFQRGKLEIQDIASQGVGLVCNPEPGETWWDVCAGSGGKALHLSALMRGAGLVLATEINRRMFQELKKRCKRNRLYRNIKPIFWENCDPPLTNKNLDGILVDAPCSCSGTWRRAPDLRWNTTKEAISRFSVNQLTLLSQVSKLLPQNGKLIYATCSIFSEENEKVVEKFLLGHPDFAWQKAENPFTKKKSGQGISFLPPKVNGNGMYVARMIRT